MKKLALLLTIILIIAVLPAVTLAAKWLYTTEPVNMRHGPGVDYEVITELQTGERVEYAGVFGKWTKVIWKGVKGYVFSKYLYEATFVSLNIDRPVNLRTGPGTQHKVVGLIKPGERLRQTGKRSGWLKLDFNGSDVYAFAKYFTTVKADGNGVQIANMLRNAGCFTDKTFLGEYIDPSGTLVIRVTSNADAKRIECDLTRALSGVEGDFSIVRSSMPSYVTLDYINNMLALINDRYMKLNAEQKKLCTVTGCVYDPQSDSVIVNIVDLDSDKVERFKTWILNWDQIVFRTSSSVALPQ